MLTRSPMEVVPDLPNCVVQQYLTKPLLIDGFKFDMRVYALVTNVCDLRVFLFEGVRRGDIWGVGDGGGCLCAVGTVGVWGVGCVCAAGTVGVWGFRAFPRCLQCALAWAA